MKQERNYPKFMITPKAERSLLAGHPWVYHTEILREETAKNGAIVDVFNTKSRYLGSGFLSAQSKIRIRLISRNANDLFDTAFWQRRIQYAWQYRKATLPAQDLLCCRIIFGEADFFPGLTVDRFGSLLSVQVLSVGMEQIKHIIFPLLIRVLQEDGHQITGIYERNDVAIRSLEGLPQEKGWYDLSAQGIPTPKSALVSMIENDITYTVDVENGQKTGFFLDQKYNRAAVAQLAKGKTVLDCFTHTGSFALNAAKGGAKHVTAIDISEKAVEMAKQNAEKNGLSKQMTCIAANVFDFLPQIPVGQYDFIILDPPAFTKSNKTLKNALRGYKEINYRAMKALPRGGYLATCSCSHFATEEEFCAMLMQAAQDAKVQLRQIQARQQSCDHPILWGVKETNYLKFYIFQIV